MVVCEKLELEKLSHLIDGKALMVVVVVVMMMVVVVAVVTSTTFFLNGWGDINYNWVIKIISHTTT